MSQKVFNLLGGNVLDYFYRSGQELENAKLLTPLTAPRQMVALGLWQEDALKGLVLLAAGDSLLDTLMESGLKISAREMPAGDQKQARSDLAREMTNTICANAQKDLGTGYDITTPLALEGEEGVAWRKLLAEGPVRTREILAAWAGTKEGHPAEPLQEEALSWLKTWGGSGATKNSLKWLLSAEAGPRVNCWQNKKGGLALILFYAPGFG